MRARKRRGTRRKKLQTKSFTKREIDEKVSIGSFRLVLDGQQRITSLYRAIKGLDEVWMILKNEDEDEGNEYNEYSLEEIVDSLGARKIQDLFKAQKLLLYFLLDMNPEKFALFFERSNSKGGTIKLY